MIYLESSNVIPTNRELDLCEHESLFSPLVLALVQQSATHTRARSNGISGPATSERKWPAAEATDHQHPTSGMMARFRWICFVVACPGAFPLNTCRCIAVSLQVTRSSSGTRISFPLRPDQQLIGLIHHLIRGAYRSCYLGGLLLSCLSGIRPPQVGQCHCASSSARSRDGLLFAYVEGLVWASISTSILCGLQSSFIGRLVGCGVFLVFSSSISGRLASVFSTLSLPYTFSLYFPSLPADLARQRCSSPPHGRLSKASSPTRSDFLLSFSSVAASSYYYTMSSAAFEISHTCRRSSQRRFGSHGRLMPCGSRIEIQNEQCHGQPRILHIDTRS